MKTTHRMIVGLAVSLVLFFAMSSVALAASKLVYADEFSTSSLNTASWKATLPWDNVTNGAANEVEHIYSANVTVSGGEAVLKSDHAKLDSSFPYGSGAITTKSQAFSYGYYEMRAKLPKGKGVWPAFWLVDWNGTHEIDIFELLGDKPNAVHMTYHYGSTQPYSVTYTGPDFSAGYHTFGVDWQPSSITWYIDGVQRGKYSGAIKSNPLMICANTAVGGAGSWPGAPDATTVFPQSYNIDYIRVYDTKPVANTAPVAAPDSYAVANATLLTVPASGVLANDTDAQGDSLTAAVVAQPAHGTLTMSANGSFTYQPQSGFAGVDTFSYAPNDGKASGAPVTVAITVAAPVVQSFITVADSYSTAAETTLTVAPASGVLVNDPDPKGLPVKASLRNQPQHGEVSFGDDGSFVYVPNPGFAGTDSFYYDAVAGDTSSGTLVTLKVIAPTPKSLSKPVLKKRTHTSYRVSGAARLGTTVQTKATRVLRVEVERLIAGKWRGYRSAYVVNPSTSYKTNVRLGVGRYRVRTSVSTSQCSWSLARSAWTSIRVR